MMVVNANPVRKSTSADRRHGSHILGYRPPDESPFCYMWTIRFRENNAAKSPELDAPLARPEALPGETYKVRWPDSDHAMYITINDVIHDDHRRPFEVFINSKNMEHYAWTVALTRMISAVFRRGGDVGFVVEELKAVFDPRGGAWMNGRYVPSLQAAIGDVIERHMRLIGFLPGPSGGGQVAAPVGEGRARPQGRQCPKCGGVNLMRKEGCDACADCGYSKCG
jgi:ribonucleoside-diphosphate reductase alpha chain